MLYVKDGILINNEAHVIAQNVSNKTIGTFYVTILQFDDNGLPVNNSYTTLDGEGNAKNCKGNSANILPGQSFGDNHYWDIEKNATKIKACISKIEFIDGTTWTNEYYDTWLQNEKDKY